MAGGCSKAYKFFNDNLGGHFLLSEDLLPFLAGPVTVAREIYLRIRGETLIRKGRKGAGGSLNESRCNKTNAPRRARETRMTEDEGKWEKRGQCTDGNKESRREKEENGKNGKNRGFG